MRTYFCLISFLLFFGCNPNSPEVQFYLETTYQLQPANASSVQGTVVFTELAPTKLKVEITLANTTKDIDHPAHLHSGNVREIGELALLLNPVDGTTGKSVTVLDQVKLTSGQLLTYALINQMNGSIKVHMDNAILKNYVLAFGNIGINRESIFSGVATCN